MKIIATGRNVRTVQPLQEQVESKLEKYEKYFNTNIEVHATFTEEKNRSVVEITIPLKNDVIFRAEEATDDMFQSIDNVVDKLAKQIRRHKTKLEKRYKAHDSIKFEQIPAFETPVQEEEEKRIVKSKKFAVKPMDPEEAVLQMEMLGHDFFVFLNGVTEEVNVVYMRKDGNYGLIEPYL